MMGLVFSSVRLSVCRCVTQAKRRHDSAGAARVFTWNLESTIHTQSPIIGTRHCDGIFCLITAADPGFATWGANSGEVAQTYYLANFLLKTA